VKNENKTYFLKVIENIEVMKGLPDSSKELFKKVKKTYSCAIDGWHQGSTIICYNVDDNTTIDIKLKQTNNGDYFVTGSFGGQPVSSDDLMEFLSEFNLLKV
jgi:hypothetical protein